MTQGLPERIGPYRIESEVGRGMMGVVFKARDPRYSRRVVALKVVRILFPVSEQQRLSFEKRFVQEARIVARLSHPGIVGVYDVGREKRDGAPYMALEFLEGRTLADILAEGPLLAWRESLTLVAQVAAALEYAHGQRVVHRDIKPANIMVLSSGQAKIMDFGLAKHEAGMEMTSTGQFMGTPLYMSPEQALGERVDARTDIFSLGSIAYTLLTGKRAFEAESVPQVMNKVAHQHPPPPTRLSPVMPPEADYLIARSMAKRRADRYPHAGMFAEDIEDVLNGRPPRHGKGWTPPATGEGTLVSTRDGERNGDWVDDGLELQPLEDETARSGVVPLMLLGLILAALAVLLFWSSFWRGQIVTALGLAPETPAAWVVASPPPPSMPPSSVSLAPETPAATEAAPPGPIGTDPSLLQATATATPPEPGLVAVAVLSPEPTPSTSPPASTELPSTPPSFPPVTPPPAIPSASPVPSRSTPRPSPATAKLSVSFEHSIKSGTLRVLVDRELVLEQKLTSRITKDLLVFKLRSGLSQGTLPISTGQRRIRIEVKTPDETRAKEIVATFRAGATRRLQVTIGRIRGNLSLAWK